jgi:hypothetical protein
MQKQLATTISDEISTRVRDGDLSAMELRFVHHAAAAAAALPPSAVSEYNPFRLSIHVISPLTSMFIFPMYLGTLNKQQHHGQYS